MDAQLILTNGRFHGYITEQDSHHQCMVVQGSKIAYIGCEDHTKVQTAKSQGADVFDLKNRVVLPGFIDSHVHLLFFGLSQQKLDLGGCKSLDEIRERISKFAKQNPNVPQILCRGWLQSATGGIALASMLDDIDPRPIYIDSNDLHSAWCNTAALKQLPINEIKAKCPEHLTCDENGNPTGLLAEWAVTAFIWPFLIQSLSMDEKLEALERAVNAYSAEGYTGVIDMTMDATAWEALQRLRETKGINLHIAAHWFIHYEVDERILDERIKEAVDMHDKWHPSKDAEFCIVGVKLMCDGVVDGCTAALSYPYGESVDLVQPLWPGEAMNKVLSQITRAGMQCAIHAIGDVAVTQAIEAIASTNNPTARHRIEHLEMATPEDAKRLGKLGITASVQPVHSDPAILEGYSKLVKPSAWKDAFPYKECLDGHANVAIGTDAPTARHLPFPNLYNATTRKSALEPTMDKITNANSALTLPQAMEAATYGAAYSRFAETWTVFSDLQLCHAREMGAQHARDATCEGYAMKLQWDIGVASRGRLTGASIPILVDERIISRPRHQGIEIDSSAGSFGQFQTNQLAAETEDRSNDRLLDDSLSPLNGESYSVSDIEPGWLHRRTPGEKELFQQCLINAGTFLCTLHLFQGIPWTNHLNHMMWVYGLFPGAENANRIADMEYRFSLEAMAIMDIPTFVRGRDTPTLGIWGCLRAGQTATAAGLADGVESVSGLPRSLLDIIARIGNPNVEEEFAAWPGHEGSVPHCHLWEAFRLAGILLSRRQKRVAPLSPTNEVLVCRLVATLDALYETRHRQRYSHILATNSILYPYTAARLEVSILRPRPSWIEALRKYAELCDAYRDTPNAVILEEILDKALDSGDNDVDLDKEAQKRGVELSLF
ncbi:exoenzymes regulatory protein [Fusarium heterosporum]|uniref:Exoenzymes regulatory protein n=1 Tax=Fusarium heterosporum TaxID=42747 RepID=A0A8H5WGK6_FUSHE|nr:exoenzymes regulatory protein [Fusarium heterosporum]